MYRARRVLVAGRAYTGSAVRTSQYGAVWKSKTSTRGILGLSRLPLSLERKRQLGKADNIQAVNFQKSPFTLRKIAQPFILIAVAIWIYKKFVLGPLGEHAEKSMEGLPPELEDDPPLFIPFPGTTKELPPEPYRSNDPEWQEFVKISKDKNLLEAIKADMANLVVQNTSKHPLLIDKAGKGMQLRRYWLDIDFPYYAPPEFERSGLEIGDDYIAWATQPVPSFAVFRARHFFYPKAISISVWSFAKVLVQDETKRIQDFFGYQSSSPPPPLEQILARHQRLLKGGGMKPPPEDGPPQAPASTGVKAIPSVTSKPPFAPSLADDVDESKGSATVASNMATAMSSHFFGPLMALKTSLAQNWRPVRDYPPRGCILISGLVEVQAPMANIVIDVKAAWDPKTKAFDERSKHMVLRRLQAKNQRPLNKR